MSDQGFQWPEVVPDAAMRRKLGRTFKGEALALIGSAERGRLYKREADGAWYLLGDAPRRRLGEAD